MVCVLLAFPAVGPGRQDWPLDAAMPRGAGWVVLSPLVGFLSVLTGIGGGSFGARS